MSELRFDERVVIVTGAGRGIGRAHALLLASKGARVVVADVGGPLEGGGNSKTPADEVVAEIDANGGKAVASYASVADESGAASIVDTALEAFGRIDAVINNAGIFAPAPFETLSTAQFQAMFDVHFFGTLFVIKAAWPHFVAAGYGRIVNTISEAMLGIPLLSSYGAAKKAIFELTRNLAAEGTSHGIRVNGVAPRAGTRMAATLGAMMSMPREEFETGMASMPPELVAPAAAYLSHESCTLNGEILEVGSGRVARLAVVLAQGITRDHLTAEDIAANLDSIMDLTDARLTDLSGPLP
jgi:NAD(P)-dependent dehydrogenase (short-subunit alcohol dehydrogenase family)